ncbi:MAG: hypothetical protein ACO1N9_06690 [Flavobacterium sp.]
MKKLFFTAMLVLGALNLNAQETKFGVKAGADFATVKVEYTNPFTGTKSTVSGSETGFFVGGFAQIGITESFSFQPEFFYVGISDSNMLTMPILGKYSFGKFSAMAGPDLNYLLDAEEDEFKIGISVGAEFDITENFLASARYSIGMGNVSISGLFVGAGYKF